MSIKLVVDMNLTPEWAPVLAQHGWTAVHWSSVGDPKADDAVIIEWARTNEYVVFTHDLDFGATLALTHAAGPSVIQIRGHNVLPEGIAHLVVGALRQYETELAAGALVVIEERKCRVRVLPL